LAANVAAQGLSLDTEVIATPDIVMNNASPPYMLHSSFHWLLAGVSACIVVAKHQFIWQYAGIHTPP
jgi:hypothetical protein